MASVAVLSPVSQACLHFSSHCGQVASTMTTVGKTKSSWNCSGSNCSLLSEARSIQSKFSSRAFQLTGERKIVSLVRSARAELAEDADTGNVVNVQDAETMERYIAESGDKLVVVDISTSTCGPCKLIFPKVVKMSKEYPDVLFLKINGDFSNGTRALMRKWGVAAVPNFRFFKNGKLVHSHVGAKEDELRAQFLTQYVAPLNVTA